MPKRSYKAVFFDLDGTLLPIDMDAFLKNYFNSDRHDLASVFGALSELSSGSNSSA